MTTKQYFPIFHPWKKSNSKEKKVKTHWHSATTIQKK